MKRIAIAQVPALFVLLIAAVLAGVASAQQAPPGPTLPQARDMIPDEQWQPSLTDPRPRLARPRRGTCFRIQSQPSLPDPRPWLTRPRQDICSRKSRLLTGPPPRRTCPRQSICFRKSPLLPDPQPWLLCPRQSICSRTSPSFPDPRPWPLIPDVIAAGLTVPTDLATAQSATWESASQAEAQWQIAQRQAYGLAQGSQTAQLAPSQYDEKAAVMRDMVQAIRAVRDAQTAQLAPSQYDEKAAVMRDMVQAIRAGRDAKTAQLAPSQYDEKAAVMRDMVQAIRAVRDAETAQLAPSHFDDSIEAPQVAAAMRAMAAIHVPSMEAIRLALVARKQPRKRSLRKRGCRIPRWLRRHRPLS